MAEAKHCDIIMRGGITSGVVYPGAVVELAETQGYTFKSVGGASAGAIAAAMTAAAQYAKNRGNAGPAAGFEGIKAMPGWFGGISPDPNAGGRSNMLALFQPQASTARLFKFLMWIIGSGEQRTVVDAQTGRQNPKFEKAGLIKSASRALTGLFVAFPVVGGLIGAIILLFAVLTGIGAATVFNWLAGGVAALIALLLGTIIAAVLLAARAALYATRRLPKNFYGICSGGADALASAYSSKAPPPLGHWLAETIDALAGRPSALAKPLTFGDLWGEGKTERDADVRLQVITTDLSCSRPFRLPFGDDDEPLYFAPSEFERLFPAPLVAFMTEKAHRRDLPAAKFRGKLNLLPLPRAADFPVAVATRMSMSFPLLLGAIPLYEVEADGTARRHWFSDGGMCSNFPIHFFDSPVPRWPTFGINLRYYDERAGFRRAAAVPKDRVYLPESDQDRAYDFRYEINEKSVLSFFAAIKSAMQNWLDFSQMDYPGFRDRIAQVYLNSDEGGMNLSMPEAVITKLSSRGKEAAALLAGHFAPGSTVPYNWPNHQTVRFRTFMRLSEDAFRAFGRNYASLNYGALFPADPAATLWGGEYCTLATKLEQAVPSPGSIFTSPAAPRPYAIARIMPNV